MSSIKISTNEPKQGTLKIAFATTDTHSASDTPIHPTVHNTETQVTDT